MSRWLGRVAVGAGLLAASLSFSDRASGDPPTTEQAKATESERGQLGGLGTALNFRGVGNEFDVDTTWTTGSNPGPIEATRLTGRIVMAPVFDRERAFWAVWAGLRLASLGYGAPDGSQKLPWGNFEPMLGLVIAQPADRLRLDIDVAPVLSPQPSTPLGAQAAMVAALATAPHEDVLFLPNLASAGRVRIALSRRWDFGRFASVRLGLELEAGYARTETAFGTNAGETGGGEVDATIFWRPRCFIEGISLRGDFDAGYTSVWTSDVVLPAREGLELAFAMNRTVEWMIGFAHFQTSLPQHTPDSWSLNAGLRFSVPLLEPPEPYWAPMHVDLEPQLKEFAAPK
jgi:hypothetical protein